MPHPHCRASERAGANQWKMFYLICHSFQYFHINLLDREKSGVSARCLVHIYLYPDNRSRECADFAGQHCCQGSGICMYLWRVLWCRWWTKVSKWHPAINTTHGKICTFVRNIFCFSMKGQKDQYSYTRYGQDPITLEGEWGNNNHVH